jgi:predicted P-loop ATPase
MAQSRGLSGINAPAWWHNLILNKDGHPARGKLENVAIPFEQDPDFQDKFWFDVFQMKILVNGALPWRPYPPRGLWELQKGDELEAWRWLEQQGIPTSHQLTLHGIAAAAYKHQFNPVLDYLNLHSPDKAAIFSSGAAVWE